MYTDDGVVCIVEYRLDCIRYKNVLPSIARHLRYIIIRAEQSARAALLVKTWINAPFISFSSFQTKYWNFRRPRFFLSKRSLRVTYALRLPSFEETVEKEQLMEIDAFQTRMGLLFLLEENHFSASYGRKFFFYRSGTFSRKSSPEKSNRKRYEILREFFLDNFSVRKILHS